ncbi:MAG: universal stress protein [Rhodospirillales bacterium]|nr:universal stress protein [Rhodospirillales bacterium]
MTYRDLLVHLDGSEQSEARAAIAVEVARAFGAVLTGLYGESDPHVLVPASRDPAASLHTVAERIETAFRRRAAAAGIDTNWLTAMTVNDTELIKRVLFAARHADLVVLGQHRDGERTASVPSDLIEQIALNCGRPVLCIPSVGRFPTVAARVLVAWNGSREAARAVNDAMPFLLRAERVRLLAINPDHSRDAYGEEPFAPMQRHLASHGVIAQCETLWVQDSDVIEGLLSRLGDEGIDLLVMGAHGHYGFPYLYRGGGTRQILRSMTTPVLMSY